MTPSAKAETITPAQAQLQESKAGPSKLAVSSSRSEPSISAAVRTENLTKRYGDLTAVDNLSLAVPTGKMFGFLGPNGAGKSTTIGCLTGLIDPNSGKIELLGK